MTPAARRAYRPCARTFNQMHATFPEGFADRMRSAKVIAVRIAGDTATAQLRISPDETPVETLHQIDGEWRVE